MFEELSQLSSYTIHKDHDSHKNPHIMTASQYLTLQRSTQTMNLLTFGDSTLDHALHGFSLGYFTVFYGSAQCHRLSETLCVRAQLPQEQGGLDSRVLFLDGGNCFDPYFITDYARQKDLDPSHVLDKILISRAFTYPQLTTLITRKLSKAIDTYNAKLVVISNVSSLYNDAPVTTNDVAQIFRKVILFLSVLAQKKHVIIIATHLSSFKDEMILEKALCRYAQIMIQIKDRPIETLTLEKHPCLEPRIIALSYPAATYPLTHFF